MTSSTWEEINTVSKDCKERVSAQTMEEAIRFFEATNSAGLAAEVIALLSA